MHYPKFKIGFMPTRRRFFSKEDSLKYKALISGKIRELASECDIADLECINEKGLLRGIDDAEKAVAHFTKEEVDCLFIWNCPGYMRAGTAGKLGISTISMSSGRRMVC